MRCLLALVSLTLPTVAQQAAQPVDPHPFGPGNIVLIVADDVGVDLVGAYERLYDDHPAPAYPNTTPVIDYLARTGLLFKNAYANPVCSPTRAQILTGKHGFRSGIGKIVQFNTPVTTGTGLQFFHDTIPTVLRSAPHADYYTAALGKWHLADANQNVPGLDGVHALGDEGNPWFHRYAGSLHNLNDEDYNDWTKTFGTAIAPPHDECTPPPTSFCQTLVSTYATVDTADDAVHLIQTLPEPFFLYVGFNAAHAPLSEPEEDLPASVCPGFQGIPNCDATDDLVQRTRCMVQWLDNEVGRVVCAIENAPQRPDRPTTVIFMGDNGTRGLATVPPFDPSHAKGTLYESGIHVPLIVKSPLIAPGLVGGATNALVNATDLFATVARIAGAPLPPDPLELRDSISFLPVLLGHSTSERKFVYAENFANNFVPTAEGTPPPGYTLSLHRRAIRNQDSFKLIQRVRPDGAGGFDFEEEMYDISRDPHEAADRLGDALMGIEPYAANYAQLRLELDTNKPHLVTP